VLVRALRNGRGHQDDLACLALEDLHMRFVVMSRHSTNPTHQAVAVRAQIGLRHGLSPPRTPISILPMCQNLVAASAAPMCASRHTSPQPEQKEKPGIFAGLPTRILPLTGSWEDWLPRCSIRKCLRSFRSCHSKRCRSFPRNRWPAALNLPGAALLHP
jgi:hypothetical protein